MSTPSPAEVPNEEQETTPFDREANVELAQQAIDWALKVLTEA